LKRSGNKLSGFFLTIVIAVSVLLVNLPLVHADYVNSYPSFPLDFKSDINSDGKVNFNDIVKFIDIYIAYHGAQAVLDPRGDIKSDGAIDFIDIVKFVDGYISYNRENPNSYDTSDHPIVYSDYFSFYVPQRSSATVWDYVLVRFYVPQGIADEVIHLTATNLDGGAMRKIQVDLRMIDSNLHS